MRPFNGLCPTCKQPYSLVDFDGVAAQYICWPCTSPTVGSRFSGISASKIRRLRRTANGTVAALPDAVYAEVRASGPCVYCNAPSEAADHVWALARGGPDLRENLVPICAPCNRSKKDRLLTEWDDVRVAHAAAIAVEVATELARLQHVNA